MKKIIISLILNLFLTITVNAGTVDMSGQWNFNGYGSSADSDLIDEVTGFFDFDAGTLTMESIFFGVPVLYEGTISDSDSDGIYVADTTTLWAGTPGVWYSLWDITDNGDGTASVVDGPRFFGPEIPYIIEGTLTSVVPIPAAAWLFTSGLIGLVGFARCKKA